MNNTPLDPVCMTQSSPAPVICGSQEPLRKGCCHSRSDSRQEDLGVQICVAQTRLERVLNRAGDKWLVYSLIITVTVYATPPKTGILNLHRNVSPAVHDVLWALGLGLPGLCVLEHVRLRLSLSPVSLPAAAAAAAACLLVSAPSGAQPHRQHYRPGALHPTPFIHSTLSVSLCLCLCLCLCLSAGAR
ncbi:hypothetical protein LIA77_09806 [Sarocladium implicatum]|nr:hypothetical protein LIA77_09806 [Sarocladium implicatum]